MNQRSTLEQGLVATAQAEIEALNSVTEQLRRVVWPTNGTGPEINALDEIEVMETELGGFKRAAQWGCLIAQPASRCWSNSCTVFSSSLRESMTLEGTHPTRAASCPPATSDCRHRLSGAG